MKLAFDSLRPVLRHNSANIQGQLIRRWYTEAVNRRKHTLVLALWAVTNVAWLIMHFSRQ